MADILDFEEIIKDLEEERKSEKKTKKSSSKEDKKQPTEKLRSNYSFLYNMSKNKIEHYIKNTTKYKTINSQIELLNVELKSYRSAGRKDLEEQTRAMINSLKDSISDLNAFASEKNIRAAREERKKELEESEVVKTLRAELKDMKKELKDVRPSSVYRKFKDLKKRLNINVSNDFIIDLDDDEIDFDDLDNIENIMKKSDSELYKEYIALCNYIGEYIGKDATYVSNMKPNNLYNELLSSKMKDEYDEKNSIYSDKKTQLMAAISNISSDSISKIVYDNFDFEIESDVNDAMDLLAASRTTFVANMAYVFCKKYNVLSEVDNIIGYGLMALSEALNRWKKFQKQAYEKDKNNIIDIDIFLGVNITGPMIKGIYEIKNKGMIHPSTSIGLDMKAKSDFEKFKKDNPDLAGLPDEQIRSVYEYQMLNNSGENSDNVLSRNVNVSSETEFGQLIASSIEEDGGDLWSNMLIDRKSMDEFNSIEDFDDILKILEIIFSLYKLNYDKKTEAATKSNKMFFDKVDYSIFRKIIGIEVNESEKDGRWTQQQVAESLAKEFGRSFTQGAVGNRIDKIYKAIKRDIISDYPNLEGALKDLKQYFLIRNNVSIFQSKIAKEPTKFKKVEDRILSRLK